MALVVLLVEGHDGAISVGPDAADRLARLGVTNVAVVRDGQTTGLVLDGWLFDLAAAPEAARAIVGPDRPVRIFQPLIQMAVSARVEGGTDVSQATNSLAMVSAALLTLSLAGAALAHPHKAGPTDQVIANGQNHGPFVSGVSCGGDPAAYGLESAHHGPDAGTPGKADGCYMTTGGVAPGLDVQNPAIH